jgi:hypothetical protein
MHDMDVANNESSAGEIIGVVILLAALLFCICAGIGTLGKAVLNIKAKTVYVQVVQKDVPGYDYKSSVLAEKISKKDEKQWIILEMGRNDFKPGDKLKVKGKYRKEKGSNYTSDKYNANIPILKVQEAEIVRIEKEDPKQGEAR